MAEILIADDDPVVRHLLSSMLKAGGHEVTMVTSGQECLDLVTSRIASGNLPALLFLDLQLTDRPGAEVLDEIRSLTGNRRIPVVIVSAQSESEVRRTYPEIDMDSFLEKPFPPDAALKVVSLLTN